MSLTEEERQKIYLEEKAKMESAGAAIPKAENSNITNGNMVSLIGGILTTIGIFLPWVTLGMLSVDAMTKLGEQAYVYLLIGLISALLSLLGISQKRSQSTVNGFAGIVGIGFLIWHYTVLHEHVMGINVMGRTPEIAVGFWVTVIGCLMILIGAGIAGNKKKA